MTVKELKEYLNRYDDNIPIYILRDEEVDGEKAMVKHEIDEVSCFTEDKPVMVFLEC